MRLCTRLAIWRNDFFWWRWGFHPCAGYRQWYAELLWRILYVVKL